MTQKVLIVDDEPGILSTISDILTDEGFRALTADRGAEVLDLYEKENPDVVFLDIWLPDQDGLEILELLREKDPTATVIMISGHGTIATAVKAMKMGAYDYIEKPFSYRQILEGVRGGLEYRQKIKQDVKFLKALDLQRERLTLEHHITPPDPLPLLSPSGQPQKTVRHSTVIYGHGLHSGKQTGMIIQPLPPDSGIHFITLPSGCLIPARLQVVADTSYATTLSVSGHSIHTVEHFLSCLHAYGISNLLIKVHGEIPVLDGSAIEFCKLLENIGMEEQDAEQKVLTIDRKHEITHESGEYISIEPFDGLSISYLLRYPAPIGEQYVEFDLTSSSLYRDEVAPARTFGFMKDLKMLNELGLGSGGRLDNCILVGEDNVINTELRFPDEFARHKVLDILGDLYLLGYPMRGRITARMTGHRDNISLLRAIKGEIPPSH